jgi:D-serine deaminase-like pyridoxal phosphate-dependent protein
MHDRYSIADTSEIITPAIVVFREALENNLDKIIEIAGDVSRLRPHCKTHKMAEVVRLELDRGITKHKCATFAEAEMLAEAGVKDIFLAYNIVGANIGRSVKFVEKYPTVIFSVTADHPKPLTALAEAMTAAGCSIQVLLDVDTGQHRTGLEVGPAAKDLYQLIHNTPGVEPGGLHVYDGQQHQELFEERKTAVLAEWEKVSPFRDELLAAGLAVPRIVAGGTPTFPVYATIDDPLLESSPGTCIMHDIGYGEHFPDMVFTPAELLLTRVISRPTADTLTVDLGYKAVASDPPMSDRVVFPDLPDAELVLQNEEHLVVKTSHAGDYEPGDELLGIPRHVCPTSALHRQAWIISDGKVSDRWTVASRDRWITI